MQVRVNYLIAVPHAAMGGGAGFNHFSSFEAFVSWLREQTDAGRVVIVTEVQVR